MTSSRVIPEFLIDCHFSDSNHLVGYVHLGTAIYGKPLVHPWRC